MGGGLLLNAGMGALFPSATVSSTMGLMGGAFSAGGATLGSAIGMSGLAPWASGGLVGLGVGAITMALDKFVTGGIC
jgi:hypothetical protein